MDKVISESEVLTPALLSMDEEQYDRHASSLVTKLTKLSAQQLASKEVLDVRALNVHCERTRLTSEHSL